MTVSENMRSRVLDALNEYWHKHHMAPSLRELAIAVECNSTSVMNVALSELEEVGLIRRSGEKGKARSAIPLWVDELLDKHSPETGSD